MPDIDDENASSGEESDVEATAEGGQLPYVAEQNAAAERGEDDSDTTDPEEKAEDAGRGDVVGGINMH